MIQNNFHNLNQIRNDTFHSIVDVRSVNPLGIVGDTAAIMRTCSLSYSAFKRRAHSPPPSWIGWALMMGISLFSQVMEKGWQWNQAGLTLSVIGCVVTAIFSLKHGVIVWWDWLCLLLGALCVIVYLSTKNAWLTTIMAIVADFIVALPTQHNAYIDPKKERSIAWHFGAMAYLVNCISCMGSAWLYAAFPLYLLCMNSSMVYLTTRRVFKQVH
jgi:hypothetical protein